MTALLFWQDVIGTTNLYKYSSNQIVVFATKCSDFKNLDLVRQGFSPYYTKYGKSEKYDADFRAAEKQARREKLNIWGDPELTKKYLRLKSKWGNNDDLRKFYTAVSIVFFIIFVRFTNENNPVHRFYLNSIFERVSWIIYSEHDNGSCCQDCLLKPYMVIIRDTYGIY